MGTSIRPTVQPVVAPHSMAAQPCEEGQTCEFEPSSREAWVSKAWVILELVLENMTDGIVQACETVWQALAPLCENPMQTWERARDGIIQAYEAVWQTLGPLYESPMYTMERAWEGAINGCTRAGNMLSETLGPYVVNTTMYTPERMQEWAVGGMTKAYSTLLNNPFRLFDSVSFLKRLWENSIEWASLALNVKGRMLSPHLLNDDSSLSSLVSPVVVLLLLFLLLLHIYRNWSKGGGAF